MFVEDIPKNQKNTHKVHNFYAKLYSKPRIKNMLEQKLCFVEQDMFC